MLNPWQEKGFFTGFVEKQNTFHRSARVLLKLVVGLKNVLRAPVSGANFITRSGSHVACTYQPCARVALIAPVKRTRKHGISIIIKTSTVPLQLS
jgi:hypothetical protein